MPAKTGAHYIANLRENPAEVWIRGERVKDVTTHPSLAGGVRSVAALYDKQHDAEFREDMVYASPSSGEPVGMSFKVPRTDGGPAASPQDDDPLGLGRLRHDGPDARFYERFHCRLGRGR